MFAPFIALYRAVQFLFWLPCIVILNPPVVLASLAAVFFLARPLLIPAVLGWFAVAMVAYPLEPRVRPARRAPKLKKVKVRAIPLAVAKIAVRIKGSSPRVSAINRRLSPELRKLLQQPREQQPAALAFEDSKPQPATSPARQPQGATS